MPGCYTVLGLQLIVPDLCTLLSMFGFRKHSPLPRTSTATTHLSLALHAPQQRPLRRRANFPLGRDSVLVAHARHEVSVASRWRSWSRWWRGSRGRWRWAWCWRGCWRGARWRWPPRRCGGAQLGWELQPGTHGFASLIFAARLSRRIRLLEVVLYFQRIIPRYPGACAL